jgi:hypothetical protein
MVSRSAAKLLFRLLRLRADPSDELQGAKRQDRVSSVPRRTEYAPGQEDVQIRKMIKLTNTGILGTVIEIAREKIKTVEPSEMFSVAVRTGKTTSEPCTKVELNDGEVHFVKESPQEIVEMIFAEAQAAAQAWGKASEVNGIRQ